ncbi:MAG: ATP-binding protein [Acidobacteriota bacterium]
MYVDFFSDKRPADFNADGTGDHPRSDEAEEIVRALKGGEIDAVIVEEAGHHQVMALAKLTDLGEITELIRALRNGEVDAFVSDENNEDRLYAVTPIHDLLSQQYHLTKAITDNATTALFILDENQHCVFMNPAAEHLTGFGFDEIRAGETFHGVVHNAHPDGSEYPSSECPINRAFPSQAQQKGEELFVHKDGHFYDVAFAASPILDAAGEAAGTVIEVRDITERKKIEQALLDADRRKDEFIATLAHELRNPLAPISNLIALMKQTEYDADFIHDARDTIERQLSKMVRLVDDLLDVSRITRNTIELRREPLALSSAIADAYEMCRPTIEQLGHKINIEIPDEAVYLHADAARLSQILGNLIHNACKFTPGGGQIDVTAEYENGDVVVKVKDNGVGIPQTQLSSVFEMFAQVKNPLGATFGGLGIGLGLAKRLVEMHGGSIEARSDGEWTGSEFVVRLPITDARPETRSTSLADTPGPKGRRILVVDDNVDSAESMTILLKHTGNYCLMAHAAAEAISTAETFAPDIILLDIGLPGMDGYAACRAIREQTWGTGIHIIAMTGWGQAEDRRQSLEAGFDAHLVKPVDIDKLYEIIEAVPAKGDEANGIDEAGK